MDYTYGENAYPPSSYLEFILAAAKIICPIVYASEATPVACPKKLHHPMIQAQIATCSGGTTCFVTKYMPPAVGYAETSSATARNQHKDVELYRRISDQSSQ